MKHSGVMTVNGRFSCPLQKVRVRASVSDYLTETCVEQTYQNTGPISIEAIYMFPLPFKAAVTSFAATVGSTRILGEIRERDVARQEYEAAIRRGDSSFLLESHRPDIFRVNLGRLQPGETASISLSYIEDTVKAEGELRWTLPTVVAPRYIPGSPQGRRRGHGQNPTARVPDADLITPHLGDTPYSLDFEASINLSYGVKSVASPSHHIAVSHCSNGGTKVSLAVEGDLLNRDLVLVCKLDDEVSSRAVACGEYAEVTFVPQLTGGQEPDRQRRDYVFLLDISGSMAGPKLEQAKKALQLALRNLEFGDRFNIVAFESNYQMYSSYPVEYNQDALNKADYWVRQLTANGGTEIYEPLARVLQSGVDAGWERLVFLFTDGQVGNEAEITEMVRANSRQVSLFPFGIDTAVNKLFIEGLAEAGNGLSEYVYPGERIEEKVIRQFARLHDRYLAHVKISLTDGQSVKAIPSIPNRLYNGEPFSFVVKAEGLRHSTGLRMSGLVFGVEYEENIEPSLAGDERLLALRYARERIREIENSISLVSEGRETLLREEAVKLSADYGLLSTFTSFVAVHLREDRETGQVETLVVPVSGPHGWELEKVLTHSRSVIFDGSSLMPCYSLLQPDEMDSLACLKRRRGPAQVISESGTASLRITRASGRDNKLLYQVAAAQNADGSFGVGELQAGKTALFVLGVLLSKENWKPYARQLKKAGVFLGGCKPCVDVVAAITMLVQQGLAAHLPHVDPEMTSEQKNEAEAVISGDVTSVLIRWGVKPSDNTAFQLLELVIAK